ncbi:DUF6913 domain-containing protein [Myroides sp. LJL115]
MLSQVWKNNSLKKIVRKSKLASLPDCFNFEIKTIGLLIDQQHISQLDDLLRYLHSNTKDDIKTDVVVFGKRSKEQVEKVHKFVGIHSFDFSGECIDQQIVDFMNYPFDMLIGFYKESSPVLEYVNLLSKAKFKVGVNQNDRTISHLEVRLSHLNAKQFIEVLLEYIKGFKNQ